MLSNAQWSSFEALLKSEEGEVLAHGKATVYMYQQAVTFESDFVPLYPLGTPMEIVRLDKGVEIHRFFGNVYLSDKRLMRIVSVSDELLPGSELLYCDNLSFSAKLAPCAPPPEKPLFSLRRSKEPEIPREFDVRIIRVTTQEMIFQYDIHILLSEGLRFFVRGAAPLPINDTVVEIVRPSYFGEKACYLCRFVSFSQRDQHMLKNFLWEYNLKYNKIF